MDNTLCDYSKAYYNALRNNPDIKYPQSQYKFFENLEPIPSSIESYKKLKNKYKVFILTKPSRFNPLSYTEKAVWVEKWLGFECCEDLILASDKTIVRGHYLIDDIIQTGVYDGDIEWEHIKFGSDSFPDWNSVIEYLM